MNNKLRSFASFVALVVLSAALCAAQPVPAPDFNNFSPVFQSDVFVVNPFVGDPGSLIQKKNQVNPAYALSETSALELMVVLKDYKPTIVHTGPFGWFTSGQFTVTRAVPWLLFPDGSLYNAGLIAWYFSHGLPPDLVQRWVRLDLDQWLQWNSQHPEVYDAFQRIPLL